MAEQLPDTYYRTPFKFNGKELDEETGLYYYGARYYDPKISIWLSVDPLAESFPNWNPYNYTMQNPINLVDPTGMSSEEPGDGDPPKGWVQRFNESISSFFNLNVYRDAEDFAASGGKDDQLSKKLSFNSRLIDGKTKALEKTVEVILMAHPYGDGAEALAYLMMQDKDLLNSRINSDGGYYLAGLVLPVVNGKEIKYFSRLLSWGKTAKGHLIKHADALGFGGYSHQELQKMVPQLRSAANQLYNDVNPGLTRIGRWGGQSDDVLMHITNSGKMLVTKQNGEFITAINKTSNNWYQLAQPLK
jgi:RHS repeat-associated protein